MTIGDELVLCSGTLAEGTPLEAVLTAAADAGFDAISMWGREYGRALASGLTEADIRCMVAEHGLRVAYLDPAWWWLPGAAAFAIPPEADELELFCYAEAEMFRIAKSVQASSILAIDAFGGAWTHEEAAEALGSFCDRAADVGLNVHLEFLPWSQIPDLETAWELVRLADRPNAGIAIDAWHWYRGQPDDDLLRTIPGDRITAVILDDGPATPEEDLLDAALHERLVPGEGRLDLCSLLRALRDIGVNAPVGVEVLSDQFHTLPPSEAAQRAADATRSVLAGANAP